MDTGDRRESHEYERESAEYPATDVPENEASDTDSPDTDSPDTEVAEEEWDISEGVGIWAALCHLNLVAPLLLVASTSPGDGVSVGWSAALAALCVGVTALVWYRKRRVPEPYDQSLAFHAAQASWWSGCAVLILAPLWLVAMGQTGGIATLASLAAAFLLTVIVCALSVKAAYHTTFGDRYIYPFCGPAVRERLLASMPDIDEELLAEEPEGGSSDAGASAEADAEESGEAGGEEEPAAGNRPVSRIGSLLDTLMRPPRR